MGDPGETGKDVRKISHHKSTTATISYNDCTTCTCVCMYIHVHVAGDHEVTYVQYPAIFVECVCAMSKVLESLGAWDIPPSLL